jgi:hypothetical protein
MSSANTSNANARSSKPQHDAPRPDGFRIKDVKTDKRLNRQVEIELIGRSDSWLPKSKLLANIPIVTNVYSEEGRLIHAFEANWKDIHNAKLRDMYSVSTKLSSCTGLH